MEKTENKEKDMRVEKLETEKNFNKDGRDRTWYRFSGLQGGMLDGVYGVINPPFAEILMDTGESIDDALSDRDAKTVKRAVMDWFLNGQFLQGGHMQNFMNVATGAVDDYDGWYYENENGQAVNAVDRGEVVPVIWDEEEQQWKEEK